MNAFDYFFENSRELEKDFVVGNESIAFNLLYKESSNLALTIYHRYGCGKNLIILLPNGLQFIKVYLAILKSGNRCVPLDPMTATETLEYISGLVDASAIFTTQRIYKGNPKISAEIITDAIPDSDQAGEMLPSQESNDIAEIIFTSGSTGKPKGVMLTHKNLIANTGSIVSYLGLTENDRMLVVLPFYYCYGLSLLHTHLRAGGSIVLNNMFVFLGSVIKDLKSHRCTGFAGVPSHFQILMRKSDTFRETDFTDLRYVTQAGGGLPVIFIDEFRAAHPATKFFVMYGQTEATARLSYLPPEAYPGHRGSIGKGIPGVELQVVDKDGMPVKEKEQGEIIARGDNIMAGYFNDPGATAEVLKNGWLHTGDLGEVDSDGFIYLTGRMKEMIKIRGNRVSPKEIESAILEIPQVVNCYLELVPDESMGEVLKAVVQLSGIANDPVDGEAIRKHCAEKLPMYKVPSIVEFADKIELSPTGKRTKKTQK